MAKTCSQCAVKIGFFDNCEIVDRAVWCVDCFNKFRAIQNAKIRKEQQEIVKAIQAELSLEASPESDPKYAAKFEALSNLLITGTLTAPEFAALKSSLLQHWSKGEPQCRQGRFTEMYAKAKDLFSRQLVAPATAQYPNLRLDMIIFENCGSGEFIIDTYVDSQARSSALIRSKVRAKFNWNNSKCLSTSFFQDTKPPYQQMEWVHMFW